MYSLPGESAEWSIDPSKSNHHAGRDLGDLSKGRRQGVQGVTRQDQVSDQEQESGSVAAMLVFKIVLL